MKEFEVNILDDDDQRFIEALKDLGMSRNIATTLTYLTNVSKASSQEIEMSTGLRQPEVSIAMRYMRKNTWVNVSEKKTAGKGRPTKIYSLSAPVDTIVQHYENKILDETQATMKAIDKLKNIGKLV